MKISQAILQNRTSLIFHFSTPQEALAVCGKFDENLARIEQRMGVTLFAQGDRIIIDAPVAIAKTIYTILEKLAQQTQNGICPDLSDTEMLITAMMTSEEPIETTLSDAHAASCPSAAIHLRKKTILARTKMQNTYMTAMQHYPLVFGVGPAGTGKTYLAVAHAAYMLEHGLVTRIILSRPAIEAGERLGFLPGDMKEKVDPYLRPLYDALYDTMPAEKVDRALSTGVIEIAPLAFMRGRTLTQAAIILDEAQNTTPVQMKMFLTRFGEGSHMVINGDPGQTDLPSAQESGLDNALTLLHMLEESKIVHFTDQDIVRHPLVAAIIKAYDQNASDQNASKNKNSYHKVFF